MCLFFGQASCIGSVGVNNLCVVSVTVVISVNITSCYRVFFYIVVAVVYLHSCDSFTSSINVHNLGVVLGTYLWVISWLLLGCVTSCRYRVVSVVFNVHITSLLSLVDNFMLWY